MKTQFSIETSQRELDGAIKSVRNLMFAGSFLGDIFDPVVDVYGDSIQSSCLVSSSFADVHGILG